MSDLCDSPNLSLPRKQPPSDRDRDIYIAVRLDKRPQEEVARQFGISQPRVHQIVREVRAWIDETLAGTGFEETPALEADAATDESSSHSLMDMDRRERLALAERLVYERLEHVYAQSLEAWRKSLQDAEVRKSRHNGDKALVEHITKSQSGKAAFLNQAMRAALAIARLMGVDTTGHEARKQAQAEREAKASARQTDQHQLPPAEAMRTTSETCVHETVSQTPYNCEISAENRTLSEAEEFGLSESERLALFEEALRSAA